jgi:peptide/nickel transport system ATP-binding protein
MEESLLSINKLVAGFSTSEGPLEVVKGASFEVRKGEAVGIVGESGCGKTFTGLSLMGLLPSQGRIFSGDIHFEGRSVRAFDNSELQRFRGKEVSMIFQDPMSSLSPFYSVGHQIEEALSAHQVLSKQEKRSKMLALMQEVGISDPEVRSRSYPHQYSGGMRQRIMIAMALANHPKLLIADEPTTALDVTIQAQILKLIAERRKERNMSLLLVSHDWGVVSALCDRVLVMYAGRIVEEGTVDFLYKHASHPYTQGLLRSVPHWEPRSASKLAVIPGSPPVPGALKQGCSFAPRCTFVTEDCKKVVPSQKLSENGHKYQCIL